MSLLIKAIFIGILTVTSYRSVPSQTDNSPWTTSNGERVNEHGVAISQDLHRLWGGTLDYGDIVYIEGYGFKVVNDVMHPRMKKHIDIWVKTIKDEKEVGVKKLKIWRIYGRNL